MITMNTCAKKDSAVSPIIGILLMIVVTVIIAAVVSGFAGSLVSGQQKVPQAQISGSFSIDNGFTLTHNGGDSIPTRDMVITLKGTRLFGPDAEAQTAQQINGTIISDKQQLTKFWLRSDGTQDITSFNPGDTALISKANCTPAILQPSVQDDVKLCFQNTDNIGKSFKMIVSDGATGKTISEAYITITQ